MVADYFYDNQILELPLDFSQMRQFIVLGKEKVWKIFLDQEGLFSKVVPICDGLASSGADFIEGLQMP